MVPEDEEELRRQYSAYLRVLEASGRPDGATLLTNHDSTLARKFQARKRIDQINADAADPLNVQRRATRQHVERH